MLYEWLPAFAKLAELVAITIISAIITFFIIVFYFKSDILLTLQR